MKLRALLIGLSLAFVLKVHGQTQLGVDVNFYTSTLVNISPDTIVPWGYSGAKTSQENFLRISPTLTLRKKLTDKLGLEFGIGYLPVRQKIHLDFYHPWFQRQIDSTLTISLHYLQVPVSLNYELALNEKSGLLFSGGLNTKILIAQEDNYQEIKFEKNGLPVNNYNRFVVSSSLGVSYQRKLPNENTVEFGLHASLDATPFVKRDSWGFYNNLYPARILQFGTSLKYFFYSF